MRVPVEGAQKSHLVKTSFRNLLRVGAGKEKIGAAIQRKWSQYPPKLCGKKVP